MARFSSKLNSFSIPQLSELLEDDEKVSEIVLDLEEVQEVQQNKKAILASNRSLAEQNLMLQPRLDHQKNELTKRYRCLQEQYEAFQLRKSMLDRKSGDTSLDVLLALLQAEEAKIDEEAENIAVSFCDGAVPLDGFIDEFQSKRKLTHLRKVKIEKLKELLLKSPAAVQIPPHIEPVSTPAPLQREPDSTPVPQPRRAPPLPPIKNVSAQSPPAPVMAYPAAPYPPIPPRVTQPHPGYPSLCMPQYPPPVPQRSTPRMAHQPGFILQ